MRETQKIQVQSLSQEDPEKEVEPYCGILAWEIPWTEEPGWQQSLGHKESDTTGHTLDWPTRLSVHWIGHHKGLCILFVSVLIGRRSDVRIGIALLEQVL